MDRRTQLGTALVVVAVCCFALPPLFPVQPVLVHDTRPITLDGSDEIEAQGYEIYAYEDLSDRGQELYVTTLENGGQYHVPPGEGAPDWEYPSPSERAEARQDGQDRPGHVVIERPEDAALPRADEPPHGEPEGERWEEAQRYELLAVTEDRPPMDSTPQLLRLVAGLLGVVCTGLGGYLVSSKSSPGG